MKIFYFLLSTLASTVVAERNAKETIAEGWKRWLSGDLENWNRLFADNCVAEVDMIVPFKLNGRHVKGQNGFNFVMFGQAILETFEFQEAGFTWDNYEQGENRALTDMHFTLRRKDTGELARFSTTLLFDVEGGKITKATWVTYKVEKVETASELILRAWKVFLEGKTAAYAALYADDAVAELNYPSNVPFKYTGRHVNGQNGFTFEKLVLAWGETFEFIDVQHEDYIENDGNKVLITMDIVARHKGTGETQRTKTLCTHDVKNGKFTKAVWTIFSVETVEGKEL